MNNHHDNQTILIVTHGGWKNALMSHLENISPQESWAKYAFDNTSISILNIDKTGEHDFETINCTKHLILSKRKQ